MIPFAKRPGHFYVCGSARQVPEDIYTAMKEAVAVNSMNCQGELTKEQTVAKSR